MPVKAAAEGASSEEEEYAAAAAGARSEDERAGAGAVVVEGEDGGDMLVATEDAVRRTPPPPPLLPWLLPLFPVPLDAVDAAGCVPTRALPPPSAAAADAAGFVRHAIFWKLPPLLLCVENPFRVALLPVRSPTHSATCDEGFRAMEAIEAVEEGVRPWCFAAARAAAATAVVLLLLPARVLS